MLSKGSPELPGIPRVSHKSHMTFEEPRYYTLYERTRCCINALGCELLTGNGNVEIWGTSPESIDEAEDRDKWYRVLTRLDIKQPPGSMVTSESEALDASAQLGYPVMVRPSFVLGGRAMEIVYRYGLEHWLAGEKRAFA